MKKRIFISHSSNNSISDELIGSLSNALKRERFEVLVDFERIKPGAKWRDEIYTWLGLCHGAVILLSPEALGSGSIWVARESAILTWRNTLVPDFLIIPVLLPGVTTDRLRMDLQFRDLRLETFQVVRHENNAATERAVLDGLSKMSPPGKTPVEEIAIQIEILLEGIGPAALEMAADELAVDIVNSVSATTLPQALAIAMLQVPLSEAVKALEILIQHAPDPSAIDRILDIIAPNWVDLHAARWIARCALEKSNKPAVALNAETKFAADMYIRRAACKPPKTCWHVVPITAVFGENTFDDIAQEIWQSLRNSFADFLLNDPFLSDFDQQLVALLQDLHQLSRPVVIVCRLPPRANTIILRLRDRFPYLHFLFLSGKELPDAAEYPETVLRLVKPELPQGKEHDARREFIAARTLIRAGG